jgi:urea ABC transporter ATP-binding protein UrtD
MNRALLEADKLGVHFGGVVAVADVSLMVAGKGITCIIGPNGAGKSTLFNMLTGTVRPTSGRVLASGEDITGSRIETFAHRGIARKFQTPSVFEKLTVRENLEIARHPSTATASNSIDAILALLGLSAVAELPAGSLAHGQKQWLEIGMALATEPKVMLLDEPTAGMGPEETERTARLVTDLSGRMAIVVIEHDMEFIRALAARTLVMHQGRVVADGSFAQIESDPMVRDIYLGRR